MSNRVETLGGYIRRALDVNRDGQITFKDFLGLFPNNAVAIAVLFVDAVVAVAEYRVFDVAMTITNQNIYKAIGFVLVSAVPFYLGQVFWLYPRAVLLQKAIAVGMVAGGLYTSAVFGLADLSQQYDVSVIVSLVIRLTVAYVVAVLVYILVDPGIKAHRAMKQAQAAAELEEEYQQLTRKMLGSWQKTKQLERDTVTMFDGDEDAVIAQLEALRGKKPKGNQNTSSTMPRDDTQRDSGESRTDIRQEPKPQTNYALADYLAKAGMTKEQAVVKFGGKRYSDFAQDCSQRFEYITSGNMKHIFFDELIGNPTKAAAENHR